MTKQKMMKQKKSQKLFQEAQRLIPGGVNSPVRAFRSVGGFPFFVRSGLGSKLKDVDGNRYIDYVGSWGPLILGHAHPRILSAISKTIANGTSFGASTELEVRLAEEVCRAVPSIEKIRFVSSGTEAVMSALRVARGFTKKRKIIKFDGCYHGHADSLLVKAGSGLATFGLPDSAGVPKEFTSHTLVARFNDLGCVEELFKKFSGDVAAVILEPVVGNMGVIPPQENFLKNLRDLCTREKALLIFDEVMTGFRLAYGGAQEIYKIKPDLTTLGKIIGGGLPVGAYGGRREIMDLVAPVGSVYQAGTLSGNPMAMAAGLEMLRVLKNKNYILLGQRTRTLVSRIEEAAHHRGIPMKAGRVGSMFTLFFTDAEVTDAETARRSDTKVFGQFFRQVLSRGVFLPPSAFEACFVSFAHSVQDIDETIHAVEESLAAL